MAAPVDETLVRSDTDWMSKAIALAEEARLLGEVPVGAVVIVDGQLVGEGFNLRESQQDPTAHAEIIALRAASALLGSWRLEGASVYVTLEPCAMCAGAMVLARIQRLIYGCGDPKAGAIHSLYQLASDTRLNHRFAVTSGVHKDKCSSLLTEFFTAIRKK